MALQPGFIFAGLLDGRGGAAPRPVDQLRAGRGDGLVEWVHLDLTSGAARDWLSAQPDVPALAREGLLAPDTEPRLAEIEGGLLIILREVNTHENTDPEDMISLRMWVGRDRLITGRLRHLAAIEDIKTALAAGTGPRAITDFIAAVGRRMAQTKGRILHSLAAELDEIDEELAAEGDLSALRPRIADLRRRAIRMQRYFRPQRAVFQAIAEERAPWMDDHAAEELEALAAEFARLAGDIEAILGRAQVTQDELRSLENDRASRISLTLTVVAAIFLPLGFATGLLGINVGGIPLAEDKAGFWVIVVLLAVLGVGLWLYFRNRRYL